MFLKLLNERLSKNDIELKYNYNMTTLLYFIDLNNQNEILINNLKEMTLDDVDDVYMRKSNENDAQVLLEYNRLFDIDVFGVSFDTKHYENMLETLINTSYFLISKESNDYLTIVFEIRIKLI